MLSGTSSATVLFVFTSSTHRKTQRFLRCCILPIEPKMRQSVFCLYPSDCQLIFKIQFKAHTWCNRTLCLFKRFLQAQRHRLWVFRSYCPLEVQLDNRVTSVHTVLLRPNRPGHVTSKDACVLCSSLFDILLNIVRNLIDNIHLKFTAEIMDLAWTDNLFMSVVFLQAL